MNYSNIKYFFYRNNTFWNASPFLKLLLLYCTGIISYKSLSLVVPDTAVAIGILSALILFFYLIAKNCPWRKNLLAGCCIFIVLFLAGNFNTRRHDPKIRSGKFLKEYKDYCCLRGTIVASSPSGPFQKYEVEVGKGRKGRNGKWNKINARVFILKKGTANFRVGDMIVFENKLREIKGPSSKFEVDFKKIYARKGIFLQQFMAKGDKMYFYGVKKFSLLRIANVVNTFLKEKLKQAMSPLSYSIAAAMLLGDKSELDRNIRNVFAKSGTMHILAVSGLHVGILFLIVQRVFSFLKAYRHGKVCFIVISLLALWSFAFITGLSNSVLRSVVMFSIFSFGPLMNKRIFGINITAFSAFLILLFKPGALYDISFQLSYAAVFSIFFFYKDIYGLIKPGPAWVDYFWQITSVSIAAQIGTFPILVFYFNHFQPFFIFFNWLAIPFAFLVLTGGIFYLCICFIPVISHIVSFLLDVLIRAVTIALEYSLNLAPDIGYITYNFSQVVLMYLLILVFSAFMVTRRLSYLAVSIAILVLFNGYVIARKLDQLEQKEVVISSADQDFILDIVEGNRYFSFSNFREKNSQLSRKAHMKRYMLGATQRIEGNFHTKKVGYELIVAGGKSYLVLYDSRLKMSSGIHFDYIFFNDHVKKSRRAYYARFADNIISLQSY